jgi:hypothetical protein
MALVAAVVMVTACAPALAGERTWGIGDDEPDELSWEYFKGSLVCFEMFEKEQARLGEPVPMKVRVEGTPAPAGEKEYARIEREAREVEMPAEVVTVKVPGSAFVAGDKAGVGSWKAGTDNGRPVMTSHAGHGGTTAKVAVDVPKAGNYRVWVRWKNVPGANASNLVRIRPGVTERFTFDWQACAQGEYLEFKTGFVPMKRPGYAVDYPKEKPGMIWQCSAVMKLPKERVVVEVSPTIHEGPFAPRVVEQVWVTSDVFRRPPDVDEEVPVPDEVTVVKEKTRAEDAKRWALWAVRPGTALMKESGIPTIPGYEAHEWAFKRKLIKRLAKGENLSADEKHMAQMVYFDEDWNLIGTPAQVAGRVKELTDPKNAVKGYLQWEEAEGFDIKSGWTADGQTDASGGLALSAGYGDGPALAVGNFSVPETGSYRLWVRFAQIKGYYNTMAVTVYQGGEKAFEKAFDEMPGEGHPGGYVYGWHPVDVKLSEGKVEVHVWKNVGKGPYAYRRVDAVVLTSDLEWKPSGVDRPLAGPGAVAGAGLEEMRKTKREALVWTGPDGDGFAGLPWGAWPTREDVKKGATKRGKGSWVPNANPDGPDMSYDIQRVEAVRLEGRPGSVVSQAIRVTNPTDETMRMALLTGDCVDPVSKKPLKVSAKVVAFQITADKRWVAMPLLKREHLYVPAMTTAYAWVSAEVPASGTAEFELTVGLTDVKVQVTATGKAFEWAKAPLAGGWCSPPGGVKGWEMFRDSGVNLICGKVLSKEEMTRYQVRMFAVPLGAPKSKEEVEKVAAGMRAMGLDYGDWAWIISDEPNEKSVEAWVAGAKVIKQADPRIQVWCNPGEVESSKVEVVKAMAPYVDVFCPYMNHFGEKLPADYRALVRGLGKVKLVYTTPCFNEKMPGAPLELLGLAASAKKLGRDGFNCFSLFNFYGYTASAWDEVNAPFPDQSVSIYPGAGGKAISSRNLEAVREGVMGWGEK